MMDVNKADGPSNSQNVNAEPAENSPKVFYDPGWNDPPMLSYGAGGPAKLLKKGQLNKRVAFPLGSPSTSISSLSSCDTPPKGNIAPPLLPGCSPPISPLINVPFCTTKSCITSERLDPPHIVAKQPDHPESERESESSTMSMETVMSLLEGVLQRFLKDDFIERDETEIRKRLDVLKQMWNEDKLNAAVQQKLMELAKALESGQGSKANDLHIEMIIDHTSQVSAWMPGIRKIVHCCMLAAGKAQTENNAGDASFGAHVSN